ncbi:MAG TPA: flavodoxin family protein [Armatimonadota bacterium]|jgi:multimeric flavodoxin WrbA
MKVVAFNGSPRANGNTAHLLRHVFAPLEAAGIETELVQIGGLLIPGCKACYHCFSAKDGRCVQDDDIVNSCVEKMLAADGIILASPTYFADVTPELKALIDRAGFVTKSQGLLRRKVGAAVVAVRRAGEIHAFDTINHFFLISEMIVPGSIYWNQGIGREAGEVEQDEEGIRTMQVLGENLAWLLGKVNA